MLAYTSNESGRSEVYVKSFPEGDGGGRWQISVEGGNEPVWSPRGDELIFKSTNKLMSVSIQTEPGFVAGKPRTVFEGSLVDTDARSHDISGDGRRHLIIRPSAPSTATQLNVIVNWFEELKRLVPTDN